MIIIGEKINGFIPKTLAAIEARDADYIRSIAISQSEAGAHYLDICAGTSPDRERETMEWLIATAQEVSDLPLCLDSSDPLVLLEMMALAKKPGLLNSVSMEEGKCEKIFPAIQGSGWGAIALTCNSSGIPEDPQVKLAIAREIISLARQHGIDDSRLFIDPLVTTLATKQDSLPNFTEAIRLIHEEFPRVHFTSGLSNISFGMPCRKAINQQFLCLAMAAGMDSAIMDPTQAHMQTALYATKALLGNDEYCMDYLQAYRRGAFETKPA
ncbi:MAG: methyltetrahydrofolate cobalamin methyltransferase [Eggerthellaceae bacterium]|nr:methyltetrahydrofolate cobalamin methyltransferase [Eggerthellaceae bacterium]